MIGAFVVVNLHKNGHTSLKQMLLPKRWPLYYKSRPIMATVHCLGKTLAKNNKNWIKIILFSVK